MINRVEERFASIFSKRPLELIFGHINDGQLAVQSFDLVLPLMQVIQVLLVEVSVALHGDEFVGKYVVLLLDDSIELFHLHEMMANEPT